MTADISSNSCRLCLAEDDVLWPLFDGVENNLAQKVHSCTSISISNVEGVPSAICEICKSKLIICDQFIRQCIKTDQKIRTAFAKQFSVNSTTCASIPGTSLLEIELIPSVEHGMKKAQTEQSTYLIEIAEKLNNPSDIQETVIECVENEQGLSVIEPESISFHETEQNLPAKDGSQDSKINPKPFKDAVKSKNKSKSKPGICKICNTKQLNMKQHMTVHSGERKHVCPYCQKAFAQMGNFKCHLNIHTGYKPYQCSDCDKAFGDPTALKLHKINHDPDSTKFVCEICEASFKYRHSLQSHIRSHNNDRRHVCGYCEKAFITSSALKKHNRTHTGERPYQCDQCPKSFASSGNLLAHKITHAPNRQYQCHACDAAFAYKTVLQHHLKVHEQQQ
ncbi:zinc finger protein 791-like [Uranotaenia lowii]|uniref:zinc finger protein 791-like n=1 Tax=Uranotaenia lowii TaxID=190385 RepID=UPI00247A77E6|nr:zinc finger protein 791-like [Uranotaenia lowii]XP_055592132.1 zinc finger protein 791-like [Uranotaenia lowii]